MKRHEISQLLMRRIQFLMEQAPIHRDFQVGPAHDPYLMHETILESGDPLALFLRSKEWVGMELGCMFRSYYCTVTVEEIEVTETRGKHYRWTHTRKCLRLRELSVA
jgi:hypothetical protein